ncbi:hypothetical protein N0V90_006063 [Kalmusia sp. IMI 367209]|nr:hypothetical protein N0V90_006063 [Kalmusia sp. IMI 367209]
MVFSLDAAYVEARQSKNKRRLPSPGSLWSDSDELSDEITANENHRTIRYNSSQAESLVLFSSLQDIRPCSRSTNPPSYSAVESSIAQTEDELNIIMSRNMIKPLSEYPDSDFEEESDHEPRSSHVEAHRRGSLSPSARGSSLAQSASSVPIGQEFTARQHKAKNIYADADLPNGRPLILTATANEITVKKPKNIPFDVSSNDEDDEGSTTVSAPAAKPPSARGNVNMDRLKQLVKNGAFANNVQRPGKGYAKNEQGEKTRHSAEELGMPRQRIPSSFDRTSERSTSRSASVVSSISAGQALKQHSERKSSMDPKCRNLQSETPKQLSQAPSRSQGQATRANASQPGIMKKPQVPVPLDIRSRTQPRLVNQKSAARMSTSARPSISVDGGQRGASNQEVPTLTRDRPATSVDSSQRSDADRKCLTPARTGLGTHLNGKPNAIQSQRQPTPADDRKNVPTHQRQVSVMSRRLLAVTTAQSGGTAGGAISTPRNTTQSIAADLKLSKEPSIQPREGGGTASPVNRLVQAKGSATSVNKLGSTRSTPKTPIAQSASSTLRHLLAEVSSNNSTSDVAFRDRDLTSKSLPTEVPVSLKSHLTPSKHASTSTHKNTNSAQALPKNEPFSVPVKNAILPIPSKDQADTASQKNTNSSGVAASKTNTAGHSAPKPHTGPDIKAQPTHPTGSKSIAARSVNEASSRALDKNLIPATTVQPREPSVVQPHAPSSTQPKAPASPHPNAHPSVQVHTPASVQKPVSLASNPEVAAPKQPFKKNVRIPDPPPEDGFDIYIPPPPGAHNAPSPAVVKKRGITANASNQPSDTASGFTKESDSIGHVQALCDEDSPPVAIPAGGTALDRLKQSGKGDALTVPINKPTFAPTLVEKIGVQSSSPDSQKATVAANRTQAPGDGKNTLAATSTEQSATLNYVPESPKESTSVKPSQLVFEKELAIEAAPVRESANVTNPTSNSPNVHLSTTLTTKPTEVGSQVVSIVAPHPSAKADEMASSLPLIILEDRLTSTASPDAYFEYRVKQRICDDSDIVDEGDAMTIGTTSTVLETANKQAEELFIRIKHSYTISFPVLHQESRSIHGVEGCLEITGVLAPIDRPGGKIYIKVWVERGVVPAGVAAIQPPPKHTSFLSKTVYTLRLFKLVEIPNASREESDGDDEASCSDSDSNSSKTLSGFDKSKHDKKRKAKDELEGAQTKRHKGKSPSSSQVIRQYHQVPCIENYTTLHGANNAACNLQMEMSHEKNPTNQLQIAWQESNAGDLRKKVMELDGKDGEERYWKTQFNVGLGSKKFELVVERGGVCGPRNV